MSRIRTVAAATYGEITRRPLFYVLLFSFSLAILASKTLSLFSFYREMHLVREMGMATITFWAFIVLLITSGTVVTQELEDRTAVTLLSKPLRRHDFLLGKFLGIVVALLPGIAFLAGVLLLTLWSINAPVLDLPDEVLVAEAEKGNGPFATTWNEIWRQFMVPQGGVVLEGAVLSFFQASILAALAVSFSAFFPMVVSASATTLVFILGNISAYMVASMDNVGASALASVIPNLGYFNLQASFSEGTIISFRYMGLAFVYAVLYISAIFLVSCSLFQKREVR